MPYDPNNVLSAVDVNVPAQTEAASNLGPAVRETRAVYKRLLTILFDDADAIKRVIGTAQLAAGGVDTAALGNLAVSTAKLADTAVTAAKLAANAVETAKIVDLAVNAAKLAANAVEEAKINTGAVTTDKLGALAVTAAKLAVDAVETAKIKDLNVSTAKLADGAVTPAKMSAAPHATLPQLLVVDTTGAVQALPIAGGASAAISGGNLVLTGSATPMLTVPTVILYEVATSTASAQTDLAAGAWAVRYVPAAAARGLSKIFESAPGLISLPTNKNEFQIDTAGTYRVRGFLQSGAPASAIDSHLHTALALTRDPNAGTPVQICRTSRHSGHVLVGATNPGQRSNGFAIPFDMILIVTTVPEVYGFLQYAQWYSGVTTAIGCRGFSGATSFGGLAASQTEFPSQPSGADDSITGVIIIEKLI